ncbi:hypothetical protein KI387_024288, partial [Taxus chinensis]
MASLPGKKKKWVLIIIIILSSACAAAAVIVISRWNCGPPPAAPLNANPNPNPNPNKFGIIAMNATVSALQRAYARAPLYLGVARVASSPQRRAAALEDCLELLDDSVDLAKAALVKIAGITLSLHRTRRSEEEVVDAQTWLSAALTNQETCIDGLRQSGADINGEMDESSHLLTRALAMVNNLREPRRPENIKNQDQDFPAWLSMSNRRLLQAPNGEAVFEANVTVAQDGSGQYLTIGEAVEQAPSKSKERYVIYIKAGVYQENVDVSKNKTNLMFVGDGMSNTNVVSHRNVKDGSTTFRSATFAVSGEGFIARDMSFVNDAGPNKHQAVALRVGADFSAIYRCSIFGYQDSLYVHSLRQFYRECNIYGTVDFVFGNAAVVLQDCNIVVRRPMPHQKNTITAQGRKDPNQNTGISIQNCRVLASRDLFSAQSSFQTYLGRPWKMYSRTVFIRTFIDDLIHPAGWLEWSGHYALQSLYYGEYRNRGPGAKLDKRVTWDGYRVIKTAEEAKNFTVANFISGSTWLPSTGIPFKG